MGQQPERAVVRHVREAAAHRLRGPARHVVAVDRDAAIEIGAQPR
jgi:hypothetical protein